MTIALFSDIHANLPALEASFIDVEKYKPDAMYCLGDLVGYNIWANEVIDEIRERKIPTIAGNYDFGIGRTSDDCGCAYKTDTEKDMGKCTHIDDYRVQKRGGKGILTVNRTDKTGDVVALIEVLPEDQIMLITRGGIVIRSSVDQVRVTGRNAQGVRLVSLDEGDLVTAVARVVAEDKGEGDAEDASDVGDAPADEE